MAAQMSDQELWERIWYGDRDKKIGIGFDLRTLNKQGSPTFSMSDNAIPFFGVAAAAFAAGMIGGWIWAVAIVGSGIILMLSAINILVMKRLRERTLAYALAGLENWTGLWDRGVVTLRLFGDPATEISGADADWRKFVRQHLRHVEPDVLPDEDE